MSFFDPFTVATPLEAVRNIQVPTPGTSPWRPVVAVSRLSLFAFFAPSILGFSDVRRLSTSCFEFPFQVFLGFIADLKRKVRASLGFRKAVESIFRVRAGYEAVEYVSSVGKAGSSSGEVRRVIFRFGWSRAVKDAVEAKVGLSGKMLVKSSGLLFTRKRLLEKLAKSQEEVFRLKLAIEAIFGAGEE